MQIYCVGGAVRDELQFYATGARPDLAQKLGKEIELQTIGEATELDKGLIERISAESRIPMIKHLDGVCHVFIDEQADLDKAVRIADNAKTQRYGTCNTMETLLVHQDINSFNVMVSYEAEVKIIDFGLAKYMQMTSFPFTPSPSAF